MKKLTPKYKRWLIYRARDQAKRTSRKKKSPLLKSYEIVNAPKPKVPMPTLIHNEPIWTRTRGTHRLRRELCRPPGLFSLRRNHNEVINFFQHFAYKFYNKRSNAPIQGIDFRCLEHLSPCAGLMLAAELDRIQQYTGKQLQPVAFEDWNKYIANQLLDLGLFELLNLQKPNLVGTQNNNSECIFIKYASNVDVLGETCAQLIDHLSEIAGEIDAQTFIYDGLVEAIKNVKHHAYQENSWCGVEDGTWWMCGAYYPSLQQLTVSVYDLGVGIPQTLPRSKLWEVIRELLSKFGSIDDGKMISAAMEAGRTRTSQAGRGKGLPIMMRLTDQKSGYLRIVSGHGEAIYKGNNTKILTQNHKLPLTGTLIEWRIGPERDE